MTASAAHPECSCFEALETAALLMLRLFRGLRTLMWAFDHRYQAFVIFAREDARCRPAATDSFYYGGRTHTRACAYLDRAESWRASECRANTSCKLLGDVNIPRSDVP